MKLNGESHNRDKVCLYCEKGVLANELCTTHYHQQYRARRRAFDSAQDSRILRKGFGSGTPQTAPQPCAVSSCGVETRIYSGLCRPHNNKARAWKMSPAQFVIALGAGLCEICAAPGEVFDHEHGLGCEPKHQDRTKGCASCFRGLLCAPCNTGLGFFRDSVSRLEAARTYLISREPVNLPTTMG